MSNQFRKRSLWQRIRYSLLRALRYEEECAFWYEKGFQDGQECSPYVAYHPWYSPGCIETDYRLDPPAGKPSTDDAPLEGTGQQPPTRTSGE